MKYTDDLKEISDDDLLARLSQLANHSRRIDAVLIAHIAEVDERRLYIRDAPSMFAYCTEALHLSEHEAYARITVARASRRYPLLLSMLADGRLHLSGIAKLVPHLTAANCEAVLTRATHRTKSQIEELIAALAPKPDVAAVVRQLPTRREGDAMLAELGPDRVATLHDTPTAALTDQLGLDRAREVTNVAGAHVPATASTVMTPLSPSRYKIQFTATAELRDKLARLQALTRHDLVTAIEAAVAEKLDRLEAKRFAVTKAPRKTLDETNTSPRSRYLPAAVRRTVRERDGNRCVFVLRDGRRCSERSGLEFHHCDPYGRGGTHDPANVCQMCRRHNAYLAEREYGKERIDDYRRRPGDDGFSSSVRLGCSEIPSQA